MRYTITAFIVVGGAILFDIITGVIKALYLDGLNSTILRQGLFHKLSELLAIGFAYGLEYAVVAMQIGVDIPIFYAVATYITVMELISIIENLCLVNPKLAKVFAPYLNKFKQIDEEKGDKDE